MRVSERVRESETVRERRRVLVCVVVTEKISIQVREKSFSSASRQLLDTKKQS